MNSATVEQMVDVSADRQMRFNIKAPDCLPRGRVKVFLRFESVPETPELDDDLENAFEEARKKRMAYNANPELLEEVRALRGCLEGSNIYDGLDGVAYQRKIRDEWEDRLVEMGLANECTYPKLRVWNA